MHPLHAMILRMIPVESKTKLLPYGLDNMTVTQQWKVSFDNFEQETINNGTVSVYMIIAF